MKKIILLILLVLPVIGLPQIKTGKVILIGIDAMSTDGFQTARIPNLMELVQNGALSMKTRGVMPTVSSPNWTAILTGSGPEQNGVTKNGWTLKNRTIEPTVSDKDGYFPSIFTLIRQQMPKGKSAIFYDWPDLTNLVNKTDITDEELKNTTEEVYTAAITYIVTEKPEFAFVYTKHVDQVGHEKGHGTPDYYAAIEQVDQMVGRLLSAMKRSGQYSEYNFIVVADHGGVGHGHGGESMAEIEIPWIISGPGIIHNRMISQPNDNFNTSPTIAHILGLKPPDAWIGKVVTGAFEGTEESRQNTRIFVPKPAASVKSGLYSQDQSLVLSTGMDGAEIRYTLTGKSPTIKSQVYKNPVPLNKNMQVRAKLFMAGNESDEMVLDFTKISGIKEVTLKDPPSTKYPAKGPLSLVDGNNGSGDYHDPDWMGFEGKNLEAIIDFGAPRKVSKLGLSCLSHEDAWIFLPVNVEFYRSDDGVNFTLISKGADKSMSMVKEGIHSYTADFPEIKTRYLKVIGYSLGVCPPGSPGQGEKAWLFTDEISIR